MKRFSLLLILFLAASATLHAAGSNVGTSAGEFLKFGPDARGIGMGHAMSSIAEDSSAIFWNPAGLAQLRRGHVTFTHGILFQDVFYDYVAYARPIAPLVLPRRRFLRPSGLGTLGISIQYLNAGRIEERINTGAPTGGQFTPRDLAVTTAWGGSLTDNLSVGLALKYIDSRIQADARTGAVDGGIRYQTHLYDWPWTVAASIHNLGGSLSFDSQRDPLPVTVRFGNSFRPVEYLVIGGDIILSRDNDPYPAIGIEGLFAVEQSVVVAIRGGYNGRTSSGDLDGFAGTSFGLGLKMDTLGVDYGWLPFGALGSTHRFSVTYSFGKTVRR
ncbi:MAG: hypothetical protein COB53_03145 [Elusimicrobia bacterium]|nr:MAG: hypothetical protein COB53_03145 [Elusimicrobiota bacterium]